MRGRLGMSPVSALVHGQGSFQSLDSERGAAREDLATPESPAVQSGKTSGVNKEVKMETADSWSQSWASGSLPVHARSKSKREQANRGRLAASVRQEQ